MPSPADTTSFPGIVDGGVELPLNDDGKFFDVYNNNGELFTTKTDTSVYDVKGGYLRLTKK